MRTEPGYNLPGHRAADLQITPFLKGSEMYSADQRPFARQFGLLQSHEQAVLGSRPTMVQSPVLSCRDSGLLESPPGVQCDQVCPQNCKKMTFSCHGTSVDVSLLIARKKIDHAVLGIGAET